MAFVESIRKSFSRHRRRDANTAAATGAEGSASAEAAAAADAMKCIVTLLGDSEASFDIDKQTMLRDLLGDVSSLLSLQEIDYFGFSYLDPDGLLCWLHDYKPIAKQMPGALPYRFTFGVKFYVADPSQLREDVTRYQYCLQLRADLFKGRVVCNPEDLAQLAALSLQSELGDFDDSMHAEGYERQYEFVPNQEGLDIYEKIVELHKDQDGLLPFEAEMRLLNVIQGLKGYGVRSLACTDDRGHSLRVDISHRGLEVNHAEETINSYPWRSVEKVMHRRRRVTCKVLPRESERTIGVSFYFPSKRASKEAWKSILEQHDFFSMELPPPKPKLLSSILRGSTFRYSGRTQYQIKRMEDFQIRPNLNINRIGSVRRSSRKLPQRSASSASGKNRAVEITVARSHSLSGATKISGNGVKIPMEEMMRSRVDRSLDNSSQDVSLAVVDQDKASMLVHLGTPAPSTANIPQPLYNAVPGDDDDLEPDYQELNSATLRSRTAPALEPDESSLDKLSVAESPLPERDSETPTARDPTTGEPMYNEISNDILSPQPKEEETPQPVEPEKDINNPYEEPNFVKNPPTTLVNSAAPVDSGVSVTLSTPKGEVMALHSVPSTAESQESVTASKSSLNKSETGSQKPIDATHVYSVAKPRSSRSAADDGEAEGTGEDVNASMTSLLSPDVVELMAELGIDGEGDKAGEEDTAADGAAGGETEEDNDYEEEPDAFEGDPFSQPGATAYTVGEKCVSPVSASELAE